MDESEDVLDLFVEENDPLNDTDLITQTSESDPSPDAPVKSTPPKTRSQVTSEATERKSSKPVNSQKDKTTGKQLVFNGRRRADYDAPLSDRLGPSSSSRNKGGRKRSFRDETGYKFSERSYYSSQRYKVKNGAKLCLPYRKDIRDLSVEEASENLALCLDEPKKILMEDTVKVIGIDKALELLSETATIQEKGGIEIGAIKKNPGGVFLGLLKQKTTDEERKSIFKRDKMLSNEAKRKSKRSKSEREWETTANTRQTLEKDLDQLEKKRKMAALPDVNMNKRLKMEETMELGVADRTALSDDIVMDVSMGKNKDPHIDTTRITEHADMDTANELKVTLNTK